MDINEYQKNALRTESIVDKVVVNKNLLIETLKVFEIASIMLDTLKRSIYYGNDERLNALTENGTGNELIRAASHATLFLDSTEKEEIEIDSRVLHGIMGISTESGELVTALLKFLVEGELLDHVNISEEMHDISWYKAILHDALDLDWEDGLEKNINKLKARFPNKFTETDAINRNLSKERETLED